MPWPIRSQRQRRHCREGSGAFYVPHFKEHLPVTVFSGGKRHFRHAPRRGNHAGVFRRNPCGACLSVWPGEGPCNQLIVRAIWVRLNARLRVASFDEIAAGGRDSSTAACHPTILSIACSVNRRAEVLEMCICSVFVTKNLSMRIFIRPESSRGWKLSSRAREASQGNCRPLATNHACLSH